MDKKQVAALLDEMGTLFELRGENPFKCMAFHNAARVVEGLSADLSSLVADGGIRGIKGIGEHLSKLIKEMVQTGKCAEYDEVKASIPDGLLQMIRIPGLGPKRVKILFEKLKIASIEDLRTACQNHRLAKLEGFGEKTEENILKGIELLASVSNKFLFPQAQAEAAAVAQSLRQLKGVRQCEIAGSLRRKKEIIGDVDIVVSSNARDRKKIFDHFVSLPGVQKVIGRGDTKSSVLLSSGIQCDLRIVSDDEYPFALNYFTGSKEHNVEMRSRARSIGLSLNEYGFTKVEGKEGAPPGAVPRCKNEAGIYRALKLTFIPPELRENKGEIESAAAGSLPYLVEEKDLRGTFHCHTNYSDGLNTLEEMAEGARKLGWQYLGIADHSKAAAYAGGLSAEKVKLQLKAIDALNERSKNFRLFKGSEVDILSDGSLDYPDKILASFDYVVAAIHSKFKMTEEEATKRMTKALKNKYVTFLAHPTGRLLLSREGYPINMTQVIDAASDYGKGIEINAHPFRLDLDWRFVRYAKERKVPLYINPDAHTVEGLRDVYYGVGIARKGWLEAKDVVNTWTVRKVETLFNSLRSGR